MSSGVASSEPGTPGTRPWPTACGQKQDRHEPSCSLLSPAQGDMDREEVPTVHGRGQPLPLHRRLPAATSWPTEPLRQPTLPAHANRWRKDSGLISDGPLSPRGTPSSPLRLISGEAAGRQAFIGPTVGNRL